MKMRQAKYRVTLSAALLLMGMGIKGAPSTALEVIGDGDPDNGIEDQRMPLSALSTPLLKQIRAVGVLRCGGAVSGTATIIHQGKGWAQMITAGHVLAGKKDCLFYPYDMYQGYGVEAISYGALYAGNPTRDASDAAKIHQGDYAFFRVKGDLSAFGSIPFLRSKITPKPTDDMLHIGYFRDQRLLAASLYDCHILQKVNGGLAFDQPDIGLDSCDSGPGASGGPILRIDGAGFVALLGIRTGALFKAKDKEDIRKKGDKGDAARFANSHHLISETVRGHSERHRQAVEGQ